MKKYLFLILTILTSLVATSCQDEDFGFTEQEVFQGAYKRNFEEKYGKVNPNQNWDLSTYAKERETRALTRGLAPTPEGYYYVEPSTMTWIKTKLKEDADNSSLGESFGLLMGISDFDIIPLYQSGNDAIDWEFHIVLVDTKGSHDFCLWNKSERIQVTGTESTCTACGGLGTVKTGTGSTTVCKNCGGSIYLPPKGDGKDIDCPTCKKNYKSGWGGWDHRGEVKVACTKCDDDHKIVCPTCNGVKYVPDGDRGWVRTCKTCGGWGTRQYGVPWINLASGKITCPDCEGDGEIWTTCPTCNHAKKVSVCDKCNNGEAHLCTVCGGDGITGDANWHNILGNEENTKTAVKIRTQPKTSSDNDVLGDLPTDGYIVYFYLKNKSTGTKYSSLDDQMRILDCPRPENISSDYQVKIIGCEEEKKSSTKGTKDFNDLVFLIVGKPLPKPVSISEASSVTSTIQKRYMIEDFGSDADWDFNDIVVDVTKTFEKKLQSVGGEYKLVEETKTVAVIQYLCGTLKLQVKIGDTELPVIEDPMMPKQTIVDLVGAADKNTPTSLDEPGYGPIARFEDIKNWDPNTNNISVKIWKKGSDSSDNAVWVNTFPRKGQTPFIIATDQTVNWMPEGVDIPEAWCNSAPDASHN